MNRISKEEVFEHKIQRSRFICYLKYIESPEEAKDFIHDISKEHKTANHNCWAYVVGKGGEYAHSSDNGEPSGTAGKPMLNALNHFELTNVVAVVTRYFGGVKLGIRGLIDAYRETVEKGIELNGLEELVDYNYYIVTLGYDFKNILEHRLGQFELDIIDYQYSANVELTIKIKDYHSSELIDYLEELKNSNKIEYKIRGE